MNLVISLPKQSNPQSETMMAVSITLTTPPIPISQSNMHAISTISRVVQVQDIVTMTSLKVLIPRNGQVLIRKVP